MNPNVKHVDVAIGVLVEKHPQFGWRLLITRRPDQVVLGGFWELPGGKLEKDEATRDCLRREFAEEVGLEIEVGRALPPIEHTYAHGHVRLHPFFCRRVAGEPRNLHVADHRWVTPGELANFHFPPANEPLLDEIREALAAPDASPLAG